MTNFSFQSSSTATSSPSQRPGNISLLLTNGAFHTTPSAGPDMIVPEGCLVFGTEPGSFIPWDNPDNIVSQDTEKAVDTAVGAICLPILFLISVPSNLLNMLVFWKQGLKERINLCLFALSLVDLLHMINNFFFNVDRLYLPFTESKGPVLEFILHQKLLGFRGFSWLSGFVSVLIACERCFCVVSPLRSQTVLKTRTTAIIIVLGTVLIMTGALVIGMRWSLVCAFDPETNTTSKFLYTSEFYIKHQAHMDLLTLFVGTVQPLTYVCVVTAATIVTSVKLKKMLRWREQTSSSTMSSREMALTRTLIAVSILYVVCSLPPMTLGIFVMFVPGMSLRGRYHNFSKLVVSAFELASFINATFNIFVYIFLGSKYKETLWTLFPCRVLM
ncbi:uncharacterized protein LOC143277030 [Babylonia areolata]|uniref:uncharacterized protein LOC143277030 n=1 Tax=Babylonia areolata TaxID=304850 RepID=UPI003FD5B04D